MVIAVCAALIFILADMKPVGKGLILGTIFSAANFIIMGETLPGKISGSRRRASIFSGIHLIIRYAILAVPLVFAVKLETLSLAATIIGLFMIQIMILAEQGINATTRKKLDY